MNRSLAFVLTLFFAGVLPASAVTRATINLAGAEFGNAKSVNVSSAPATLDAAPRYYYALDAKIRGTGLLAPLLPEGTSLEALLEQLQAGAGAFLSGNYENPSGTLPFTFIDQSFDNTIPIGDIATARIAFDITGDVTAGGVARFRILNVVATAAGIPLTGGIVFEPGSKLTISVPAVVEFGSATGTVGEDTGSVSITVVRSASLSSAASIRYSTADGTASAGGHYSAKLGTLNFAGGDTFKTISIPIIPNTTVGADKTFTVALSRPGPGTELGAVSEITVTIVNNDTGEPPSVRFTSTTFEGREGGSVVVELERSGDINSPISVRVDTVGSSALPNRHFKPITRTVSFGPGQTLQTVAVSLIDNRLEESGRSFGCELVQGSVDVVFGDPSETTISITEDDYNVPVTLKGPFVGLINPSPVVVSNAGVASITVTPFGVYTAKLQIGGKPFTVKGKFGSGGIAGRVQFAKNPNRFFDLSIDISNAGSLTGSVRDDAGAIASFFGIRSRFSPKVSFSRPGGYPLAFSPVASGDPAAEPTGHGFAVAKLGKAGTARVAGRLADNSPFAFSSVLIPGSGSDEQVAAYAPLNRRRGMLHGTLIFPAATTATGDLRWKKDAAVLPVKPDKIYPAGFDVSLETSSSALLPPADLLTAGTYGLDLAGGNLSGPLSIPATVVSGNKVTADAPNANGVQMKLTPRTWLLTGKFVSDGATHKFSGIVLPSQGAAFGFFVGAPPTGTQTGSVELAVPAPPIP